MDVSGSVRPPQVKSVAITGRRLLGDLLSPPPSDSGSSSSSSTSTTSDELTEDDVFWIDDLVTADFHETNDDKLSSSSAPSSSSSLHRNSRIVPPFGSTESFGILAALSDYDKRSVHSVKASIVASSRMIPKSAQERLIYRSASSFSAASTGKYQSAPVKVPMMPKVMIGTGRLEFGDEDDRDDMMLPPHEIVARTMQRSHSQIAAYSVLEGAGRTLKGRDLRQVRNAIWRRTGFLD